MGVARVLRLTVPLLLAAVGVAGAANPPRATGGLVFSAATPVDPQRVATAPALDDDPSGGFWIGAQGASPLIRRSVDGGDTYHATTSLTGSAGPIDVEVDDRGIAYGAFRRGVDTVGVALSVDGGHTWGQSSFQAPGPLDEEVSVAVDGGIAGEPSDDTVFVAFRTAQGAFVYSSATGGGLPWLNAAASAQPLETGARCGRLRFDPVMRKLHLPCVSGGRVELVTGTVPVGRRTGISFQASLAPSSPGGVSGVPALAVDLGGNVYAVWVDTAARDLYYAASGDAGRTWRAAQKISGEGAETGALPAAVGGVDGTFAVAWLATEEDGGTAPEALPSVTQNPRAAAAVRWYAYYALVRGAGGAPSIFQQRVTAKPVHYGQVCASCPGGDPLLGDALGLDLERATGAATVVFPDTTSQHHVALLSAARQVAGPTPLGQSISRPVLETATGDFAGDAPWPAFAPAGGGTNQAQLDLTRVELSQPLPTTLRVRMTVSSLASLAPPPGKASSVWLTRFQVLGTGAQGESIYRLVYAGAESVAGAAPTFFAGATTCDSPCAVLRYPATARATGSVAGNTITVDVRLDGGFGPGVELEGDRLLDVSAHAFGRSSPDDLYADVDSTLAFDYRLDQRIGPTTGKGKRITVKGAIRGTAGKRAAVNADVYTNRTGRLTYADARARVALRSSRITKATVRGRTATISGTGTNGSRKVSFVATVVDRGTGGRRDTFGIRLSTGYRRSGLLLSGDARIRNADT